MSPTTPTLLAMPNYAKSLYETHWRIVDHCGGERHTASPRTLQLYFFQTPGRPMQATLDFEASIESRCRFPGLPTVTPIQYPLALSAHIGSINPLPNDLRHFEHSEHSCDKRDWDRRRLRMDFGLGEPWLEPCDQPPFHVLRGRSAIQTFRQKIYSPYALSDSVPSSPPPSRIPSVFAPENNSICFAPRFNSPFSIHGSLNGALGTSQ